MFCSLFFAFLFSNLLYSLEAKHNFFLPFFFLTYISSFHSYCLFSFFPFILFLLPFLFLPYYFFFFSTFLSLFFPLYSPCFLSSLSFILSLSFLSIHIFYFAADTALSTTYKPIKQSLSLNSSSREITAQTNKPAAPFRFLLLFLATAPPTIRVGFMF